MAKLRKRIFVLTLAGLCAAVDAHAQGNVNTLLAVVQPQQAKKMLVLQPPPEYPPVAKVNYLQGHVELELRVNDNGKVASAHVLTGNAILAVAALQAARKWVYRPLDTRAGPAGFTTAVDVKFNLNYHGINLTPREAEEDFLRQVKPPEVVHPPLVAHPEDIIHMRLLVNDQGQVVDRQFGRVGRVQLAAARETLRGWTFHPAHWGTLPIAAYLDVDVPVSASSLAKAIINSDNP